MPTLADSLLSSSARRLGLRMRPDLLVHQHRYQGRPYWVVKDPVGLNYFRFQEEEFALLEMLDGAASLDDLKQQFERQFAPQQISLEELGQFVGMLHRSGLVIADMPGQGEQLLKRRGERRREELLGSLSNVLAIRFKGIDPERILSWLYPKVRWFFTRTSMAICLMLLSAALLLVMVQFETFWTKLPTFHQFFAAKNWLLLAVAMAATKVLHEFGHGLSCKHFGGECHELGFMLLVLTPCLYCNVSDSWMLRNKWHRAAIGAAGMYVELVLASLATFVWWNSEPGMLNSLALNTMFVCSVSTVVFNANPLLRYDGYYILSDLMEIPNLRQKATTILSRKMGAWCLGLEEPDDPFLPERNQALFALYSVASAVYGWFITFSILWFLQKVFEPYRLQVIGQMIALAALFGLVVRPLWKVGKFFYIPGHLEQVKKERLRLSVILLAAVLAAVVLVPFPYRIFCTLEIETRDAKTVYIDVPGVLKEIYVKPGQKVSKWDKLARLENIDLELTLADLTAKQAQLTSQLENLRRERFRDPSAGLDIPQMQESLEALAGQIKERRRDVERLTLLAPSDGVVFPLPSVAPPQDHDRLPVWSGLPLDERNLGATLKEGTPYCQIGNPLEMEAVLVIDQSDIDLVEEGRPATIKLDEMPGTTFSSQIAKISKVDLKVSPRTLSLKAGGDLQTKTDPMGVERPASTSYQAIVPLEDQDRLLVPGLRGQAKVSANHWLSLSSRLWRSFSQTFNFRL